MGFRIRVVRGECAPRDTLLGSDSRIHVQVLPGAIVVVLAVAVAIAAAQLAGCDGRRTLTAMLLIDGSDNGSGNETVGGSNGIPGQPMVFSLLSGTGTLTPTDPATIADGDAGAFCAPLAIPKSVVGRPRNQFSSLISGTMGG